MLRLAHFSDVHLYAPEARWTWRDWCSRRLPGWINLKLLRRGRLFRHAVDVFARLIDDIYARRPDFLIFSGDGTALGAEEEYALVAKMLLVGEPGALPGVAVPGNHDYYTRQAAASGLFEKYFAPWLEGERIDDATYPFARRVGPIWLIGLNSSTGNRWFWDATGRVGPDQLDRLRRLLALPHIAAAPRILVTHFPINLANGAPENRFHHLRDLQATLNVVVEGGICLWLHGHRHHPYYTPPSPQVPLASICVGSGTQADCWTYAEYALEGQHLSVERRCYQPATGRFETAETFALSLACENKSPRAIEL